MPITKRPARARENAFIEKKPANGGNKTLITLRMDPDLLDRVDRAAKRLGISRSAFLAIAAAEKLEP